MGWFDGDSQEQQFHNEYNSNAHEAKFSHELLGGAAAFYAAKKYEDHVAENGPPPTHALAKELLAGFTGAFVDREIETRGLDFVDKEEAKREARKRAERGLADSGDY